MSMRGPRNYLIKRRLQLGLTLRFLLLTVIFSLFIGFEVYITVWPVVSEFIPEGLMDHVWRQILFRLIFFAIPAVFVIVALSIVFTHRVAGPLYRLEQILDRLIGGEDVEPANLRKGDELQDLAAKINALIPLVKRAQDPVDVNEHPPPAEP
jgi:hypothetical protein